MTLKRTSANSSHPCESELPGSAAQELLRVEAKITQLLIDFDNGLIAQGHIERPEVLPQHARAPVILRSVELGSVTTVSIVPPACQAVSALGHMLVRVVAAVLKAPLRGNRVRARICDITYMRQVDMREKSSPRKTHNCSLRDYT